MFRVSLWYAKNRVVTNPCWCASILFGNQRVVHLIAGTTVENKGKLILTEIFPSVQKHDIF